MVTVAALLLSAALLQFTAVPGVIADGGCDTIYELAQKSGNFTVLTDIIEQKDLISEFNDPTKVWTIFAPSDAAFGALSTLVGTPLSQLVSAFLPLVEPLLWASVINGSFAEPDQLAGNTFDTVGYNGDFLFQVNFNDEDPPKGHSVGSSDKFPEIPLITIKTDMGYEACDSVFWPTDGLLVPPTLAQQAASFLGKKRKLQ